MILLWQNYFTAKQLPVPRPTRPEQYRGSQAASPPATHVQATVHKGQILQLPPSLPIQESCPAGSEGSQAGQGSS